MLCVSCSLVFGLGVKRSLFEPRLEKGKTSGWKEFGSERLIINGLQKSARFSFAVEKLSTETAKIAQRQFCRTQNSKKTLRF